MHIAKHLRTVAAGSIALRVSHAVLAGGELGLNQVWSRLADIYGEPGT